MKLLKKLSALFHRRKFDADMTEEMRLHLEMQSAHNVAAGMSPEEARYAARRQFGGVEQIKEVVREQHGVQWLDEGWRHVRFALRQLRKNPGFTTSALATLAICLGANLTIFAVVDSILIRALPYPDSGRLVTLYHSYPKANVARDLASLTTYYERRGHIPAFVSLAAISPATAVIGDTGATAIENLGRVSPEFFATLGVDLFMGRRFTDAEMTYQTDHVAVISHEFWRSRFNADPAVLGKTIRRDGIDLVIVGVLPPGFRFLSFAAPLYVPLSSEDSERNLGARHSNNVIQIARLAPGATLADAQAQIDANDAAHAAEFPHAQAVTDAGFRTHVAPLHADHVASVRPTLLLLQAGALLLLVIGGVNLVNLLLNRAAGRSRELAIRQSLGAGRQHVIREVMTEILLLTGVGALLGLAVGATAIKFLTAFGADRLPLGNRLVFDFRTAAVALFAAVALGLALGLPIVWFNLSSRLALALKSESHGSTVNRATQRLRRGFVVAQVALAFVLLVGAGLLGLSLRRTMAVSPGFRADHVIVGRFNLTWMGYHDGPTFPRFFDQLEEKGAVLPGVVALGAVSNLPLSGMRDSDPVTVPGHEPKPGESVVIHNMLGVAGNYFGAMGIPLREGRTFDASDIPFDRQTCVVDEDFVRRYWPEGGAVGKQIYRGANSNQDNAYVIIGVVGAVKQNGLTERTTLGSVYFTYTHLFVRNYFLVARTGLAPELLAGPLARMVREIDPEIPLTGLRPMTVHIDESLAPRRSPALMAGVFAASALLLAAIGLYGVMAYAVVQRTSEFGIRMALGARPGRMMRMVLGESFTLVGFGLLLGGAGGLGLTRMLGGWLYETSPLDPRAFAGVALALLTTAVLASWLPARRAAGVDPIVALRGA